MTQTPEQREREINGNAWKVLRELESVTNRLAQLSLLLRHDEQAESVTLRELVKDMRAQLMPTRNEFGQAFARRRQAMHGGRPSA